MKQTPTRERAAADDDGSAFVQWANLVVWTLVAVIVTLLAMLLIPLHLPGGFLIPVAPVLALVANLVIPWMLLRGTGWNLTRFVPAVVWAVLSLAGATPTGDGDLLISGTSHSSGIGVAYLGIGALGAVLGIYYASSEPSRLRRRR